jgi:hypothetical protein
MRGDGVTRGDGCIREDGATRGDGCIRQNGRIREDGGAVPPACGPQVAGACLGGETA